MTSSDDQQAAGSVIDRIVELLAEQRLRQTIDDPLDAAASSFRLEEQPAITHVLFHRVLGDFVAHAYERGLPLPQKLSPPQARAEAIALLDAGYQGAHSSGYEAALLDAMDPALDGMTLVLTQLTETIKTLERQKYTRWVFTEALAPLDWRSRCRIAEVLLDRLRAFLPPELLRCTAAQLADEIPALIITDLGTSDPFQHLSALPSMLGT
jgi:hypothetical protein